MRSRVLHTSLSIRDAANSNKQLSSPQEGILIGSCKCNYLTYNNRTLSNKHQFDTLVLGNVILAMGLQRESLPSGSSQFRGKDRYRNSLTLRSTQCGGGGGRNGSDRMNT